MVALCVTVSNLLIFSWESSWPLSSGDLSVNLTVFALVLFPGVAIKNEEEAMIHQWRSSMTDIDVAFENVL